MIENADALVFADVVQRDPVTAEPRTPDRWRPGIRV
jgi:hypothetical protein